MEYRTHNEGDALEEILRGAGGAEGSITPLDAALPALRVGSHAREPDSRPGAEPSSQALDHLQVRVQVEIGRVPLGLREAAGLGPGRVVDLDKRPVDEVTLIAQDVPFARGQLFVSGGRLCVRITRILSEAPEQ